MALKTRVWVFFSWEAGSPCGKHQALVMEQNRAIRRISVSRSPWVTGTRAGRRKEERAGLHRSKSPTTPSYINLNISPTHLPWYYRLPYARCLQLCFTLFQEQFHNWANRALQVKRCLLISTIIAKYISKSMAVCIFTFRIFREKVYGLKIDCREVSILLDTPGQRSILYWFEKAWSIVPSTLAGLYFLRKSSQTHFIRWNVIAGECNGSQRCHYFDREAWLWSPYPFSQRAPAHSFTSETYTMWTAQTERPSNPGLLRSHRTAPAPEEG